MRIGNNWSCYYKRTIRRKRQPSVLAIATSNIQPRNLVCQVRAQSLVHEILYKVVRTLYKLANRHVFPTQRKRTKADNDTFNCHT